VPAAAGAARRGRVYDSAFVALSLFVGTFAEAGDVLASAYSSRWGFVHFGHAQSLRNVTSNCLSMATGAMFGVRRPNGRRLQ
jgi:hypothetical protein